MCVCVCLNFSQQLWSTFGDLLEFIFFCGPIYQSTCPLYLISASFLCKILISLQKNDEKTARFIEIFQYQIQNKVNSYFKQGYAGFALLTNEIK